MWSLVLGTVFSLLVRCRSDQVQVVSRSCSYVGVFHVEGGARYALSFNNAKSLCNSLGATLATEEQIHKAYNKGMETCRYGWISNQNTTILRHSAHSNCASNLTGVIFHQDDLDTFYDAYCYNKSDLSDKNCELKVSPVFPNMESSSPASEAFTTTDGKTLISWNPGFTPDHSSDSTFSCVTSDSASTQTSLSPNAEIKEPSKLGDWIVIFLVILAVALIILLCLTIAFRKSLCGKREKLKITTEKSTVSVRTTPESQEMVMLTGGEKVHSNGSTEEENCRAKEPLQV